MIFCHFMATQSQKEEVVVKTTKNCQISVDLGLKIAKKIWYQKCLNKKFRCTSNDPT